MDVTVCVATFGDSSWVELAEQRALPSAEALGVPTLHVHAHTLHEARNDALNVVTTEHVCFLDADDELEAGYFDRIAKSDADIRVPSVRYMRNNFRAAERMPQVAGHTHACTADCLAYGNWIVIGAVAPTELLRQIGGFRDFPVYEDWDLWLRAWKAGATIEACPAAVYRAHVRRDSRNRGPAQEVKNAAHRDIAESNGLLSPV